jgi:hypothetical protein
MHASRKRWVRDSETIPEQMHGKRRLMLLLPMQKDEREDSERRCLYPEGHLNARIRPFSLLLHPKTRVSRRGSRSS